MHSSLRHNTSHTSHTIASTLIVCAKDIGDELLMPTRNLREDRGISKIRTQEQECGGRGAYEGVC